MKEIEKKSQAEYPAVPSSEDELEKESKQLTRMLKNKTVARIWRPRSSEICVEFLDGTRLYAESNGKSIETSLTGGNEIKSKSLPRPPIKGR